MLEAELDVGSAAAAETLDRIGDASELLEGGGERLEIEGAELREQRFLVLKVMVDRRGRVLDAIRDGPHGGRLVTFLDEHLPGGRQNALARLHSFAGAALSATHDQARST